MSSLRYRAARDALGPTAARDWDDFLEDARGSGRPGDTVAANCELEHQFETGKPDPYAHFMSAVADPKGAPGERFIRAAHDPSHQGMGREATLPDNTILQRFANRDTLESSCLAGSGWGGPGTRKRRWRALLDIVETRTGGSLPVSGPALDALRELEVSSHQVFCTFDEDAPHLCDATSGPNLPGTHLRHRLDGCGLPPIWDACAPGARLWRLCFRLPPDQKTDLPTVADAGWNEVFRPETDPKALFGRAWDISKWSPAHAPPPHAGGAPGNPEVVHAPPRPPVDWACLPVDEGAVP